MFLNEIKYGIVRKRGWGLFSNKIKYEIGLKTGWGLISDKFIKVCFDVTLSFYS